MQLVQPQFEILSEPDGDAEQKAAESLEIGRIVPIYESAGQGKLTSRWFRRIIRKALEDITPELPEGIPAAFERLNLAPREGHVESALAGRRLKHAGIAVVPNTGPHPTDF